MALGAYHWFDPMMNALDQAHLMRKECDWAGGVDFYAWDVEQYWQDWREFEARKITRVIPSKAISEGARAACEKIRGQAEGKPVLVYTRASFVDGWAPDMARWMGLWDLWLAGYPYSKTRLTLTWEELRARWLPKLEGPALPRGGRSWRLWQFSGDKFSLPGTGGVVDLNWFRGGEEEWRRWLAGVEAGAEEEKVELGRWRALYALNVREGPGVECRRVGRLGKGEVVEALEVARSGGEGTGKEEEVWVRFEEGWASAVFRRMRLMEVVS